jgi:hypothetical protein
MNTPYFRKIWQNKVQRLRIKDYIKKARPCLFLIAAAHAFLFHLIILFTLLQDCAFILIDYNWPSGH